VNSIEREFTGSAGVRERGEHTKVVYAYLGGLTVSGGDVKSYGKEKQSLVNGAPLKGHQKSDYLIVVMKLVKAGGAKGVTDQHRTLAKHG
jgi:hypothetical protein